jgi:hypothetical protein
MKKTGKYTQQATSDETGPDTKPQSLPPDCPPAQPEPQPGHEQNTPYKHSPEISPQPNHPLAPPAKQPDPGGDEHAFRDVIRMYPAKQPRIAAHRLMNLAAGYKISDLLKLYGFVA